jgi:FkbM family methyltransferase
MHWLDSLSWQADFYLRTGTAKRSDPEFDWHPYELSRTGRLIELRRTWRRFAYRFGLRGAMPMSVDWVREHASLLWDSRCMLADETSRLMFDSALLVRMTSHRRYYVPRIDFDDLVTVLGGEPFAHPDFPHDYIGSPLGVFEVIISGRSDLPPLRIVTRGIQLQLVNSYRQYMIRRNGFDFSPRPGDVVMDCGACIGEVSMLFAGMTGPQGEVHLFDPLPLHARFCRYQVSINPGYADSIHVNELAVGNRTHAGTGQAAASNNKITPGARIGDEFPCTTLDDYVARGPGNVDFIKMDIEGTELNALDGAARVLREFRPRLAISGYHKPSDFWEIPNRIKDLNPDYILAFGHHTPIIWESVFYAADPSVEGPLPFVSGCP